MLNKLAIAIDRHEYLEDCNIIEGSLFYKDFQIDNIGIDLYRVVRIGTIEAFVIGYYTEIQLLQLLLGYERFLKNTNREI